MHFSIFLLCASIVSFTTAYPSNFCERALPAYFLLAGNSTTAVQSTGGGGWGDGFLNYTLKSGSSGHNYGHNGTTTASFRSGGDWATVVSSGHPQSSYNVYVTIQFGHNDPKTTSGILVTPLTRRTFSDGKVVESLVEQRTQTIVAANSGGYDWVDLNIASEDYCNEISETASHAYNLVADDNTHLNIHGGVVFGRMESDLMVAKYADIKAVTQPNATLSALIAEEKAA